MLQIECCVVDWRQEPGARREADPISFSLLFRSRTLSTRNFARRALNAGRQAGRRAGGRTGAEL